MVLRLCYLLHSKHQKNSIEIIIHFPWLYPLYKYSKNSSESIIYVMGHILLTSQQHNFLLNLLKASYCLFDQLSVRSAYLYITVLDKLKRFGTFIITLHYNIDRSLIWFID